VGTAGGGGGGAAAAAAAIVASGKMRVPLLLAVVVATLPLPPLSCLGRRGGAAAAVQTRAGEVLSWVGGFGARNRISVNPRETAGPW